jgi:uncharacterized protein (DUF58 family)
VRAAGGGSVPRVEGPRDPRDAGTGTGPLDPAGWGPLLDSLRGVRWQARRIARGVSLGTHPSRMVGASPEFTEYRPYRQGEDPRRLDWKLLARTDRAYLRITSDRALLGTVAVLDASASMAFPADTLAKWIQACRIGIGLLAVAHAAGDPVGLLVATAEGVRGVPPRTRRGTVAEAARLLGDVRPIGGAALEPALALVGAHHRVVLVSDFLDDEETARGWAAERVRSGAEVHAVHVVADEEIAPAAASLVIDPERPALRRSLGPETRAGYEAAFAAWRADLARSWRAAGVALTTVRDSEPADHAVRRVARAEAASPRR